MKLEAGEKPPEDAVKSTWKWSDGSPVYARLVPCNGYSRTNMMYGGDGYIYLCIDMAVYVCSYNPPKVRYLRVQSSEDGPAWKPAYLSGDKVKVLGRHRSVAAAMKTADEGEEVVGVRASLGGTEVDRMTCRTMPRKGDLTTREFLAEILLK